MKPFDITHEKYHVGYLVWDSLRTWPDIICQIDAATGDIETNASVMRRSVQLARCFLRFGIKPGDVLAIGGRNHINVHIPYYAGLMIGMSVAGVDPEFKLKDEIKIHFNISSPKIALCQKESFDAYQRAIKELELDTRLICFDEGEHSMKRFIQEYDDKDDGADFRPVDFDVDEYYGLLLGTGGSSGVIKIAAFKHKNVLKKILEYKPFMPSFPYDGVDNVKPLEKELSLLNLSPVQWIGANFGAITCPAMRMTKIMTSAPCTPDHVIDIINKYKPVSANMGPSIISGILNSDKECDFSSFDLISIVGAKIPGPLLTQLRAKLRPGARAVVYYGQTENLGAVLSPNPSGPLGNVGICLLDWQKNIKAHVCHCGEAVDGLGHHGLSCSRSSGRFSRHSQLNDIIRRALVTAAVPAVLKPNGLVRDDGKRPDGMSLLPWKMGRPLAWDATCVDTLAPSHLPSTAGLVGTAAASSNGLVDPDTGVEITKPNVPGEMWTKVTSLTEYYRNPEETAASITEDGWYRTGDILYRDEKGNYFFVERLKMLIKYRNYHITPHDIESVILEHPGVSDVSVTSITHDLDDEHPVACVVRKKGSNVTAQEIKDLVASKRSDSQRLRGGVVFLDELPLTSTLKIARGKLKEMVRTAHRE